jgi:glycosyltransferase involved in cell wall biosynthesis
MKLTRLACVANVFPKLSETFIANELAELRRRGIEVRVVSLRQPTDTLRHEMIAREGLDAVTCAEPARALGLLGEFKPQLLHAHFATEPAAAARDWAGQLGVPFSFTAHGYDIRRKAPTDFAARAAAASVVVTVSEANRRHIINTFGVPSDKLRVIPNGVDTEWFRPANADATRDRKRPTAYGPDNEDVPLVVCVARHVRVKNLGLLLEACAVLRTRGVRFRCVSVGDGVCRGELEVLRTELGLESVVEFVGAQEQRQVREWWQRANLAVLTSESEGMPVCLMEAAACAVPAVATGVGGIPELVIHGETGLVTPAGDAEACAQALRELMENPKRAVAMGLAARDRVVAKFSLARQVDQLLEAWSEVL